MAAILANLIVLIHLPIVSFCALILATFFLIKPARKPKSARP